LTKQALNAKCRPIVALETALSVTGAWQLERRLLLNHFRQQLCVS
jgi:hypothetical protein